MAFLATMIMNGMIISLILLMHHVLFDVKFKSLDHNYSVLIDSHNGQMSVLMLKSFYSLPLVIG